MERCARCILPRSHPGGDFDSEGVCAYCRHTAGVAGADESKAKEGDLLQAICRAKDHNGPYDCIVPFSGGKDSTYVLYKARVTYGLRPLAVNFDNGMQSPAARKNIRNVASALDVPVITLAPPWSLMKKLYVRFLAETGEFCSACNGMGYLLIASFCLNEAIRLGYPPLALGGWSSRYEAMPEVYSFDMAYFADVLGKDLLGEVAACPLANGTALEVLRSLPDPRTLLLDGDSPVIYLMLPEYIEWDVDRLAHELVGETPWRFPDGLSDDAHFDCLAAPVSTYLEKRKYGFSQSTISLSARVRDGLMTRDEALARAEPPRVEEPHEMEWFLDQLGIIREQIRWDGDWHPQWQSKIHRGKTGDSG